MKQKHLVIDAQVIVAEGEREGLRLQVVHNDVEDLIVGRILVVLDCARPLVPPIPHPHLQVRVHLYEVFGTLQPGTSRPVDFYTFPDQVGPSAATSLSCLNLCFLKQASPC